MNIFREKNSGEESRVKKISRIVAKKMRQSLKEHRRPLIATAVILFIFSCLRYFGLGEGIKKELMESQGVLDGSLIIEQAVSVDNQGGFLDSLAGFTSMAIPPAQANADFSLDDELENQDVAVMESGFISPGIAADAFINMKKETISYIVQSGDSPFSIALKFGINTETVLWANNLRDGDLIKPSQQLLILPINGVRIKILAKDSIASLAKKYKGKEEEIRAFNNIYDDAKLIAGNFIIIPNGEMVSSVRSSPITAPKYAQNKTLVGGLIVPTTGRNWGRIHGWNGVDVANVCGTPIYASAAGTIILSDGVGWNYGYGKYVMIKHRGNVTTVYGHASRLLVNVGDAVEQGQLIALMGTTGRSTGCHLHFEVRGAKNPLAKTK